MKRYTVVLTDAARADLKSLARYIASEGNGPRTALAVVGRIEEHCLGLEAFSERGRRLANGDRSIQFEQVFKIVFRVGEDHVDILGVGYRGRAFKSWDPA